MKRIAVGFVLLLVLAVIVASPSSAVAPYPDGYTTVHLHQGWFNSSPAWYIATAANNIWFAQTQGLTLVPKLSDALSSAAPIYIVTNYPQAPVFDASPVGGPSDYSGLWQVHYIKWLAGSSPRPITNSLPESIANPTGIPTSGISDTATNIVLDYSILILGQLGNRTYSIPQLVSVNYAAKTAVLPFFYVYCTDSITKRVSVHRTLITDVEYAEVAALLQANYAPGLHLLPNPATQKTWLFTPYPIPGWEMSPPSQLPVTEFCPTDLSWRNSNFDYSPITNVYFLDRTGASISSIITNPDTIALLIGQGELAQTAITTVNGAVIPADLQ